MILFFRSHRVFLSSIESVKEPDTFAEAASQKCRQPAKKEEIDALQHNLGTWLSFLSLFFLQPYPFSKLFFP